MKTANNICGKCGAKISDDTTREVCPACLLETGLGPLPDQPVSAGGDSTEIPSKFGDFEIARREDGSLWELGHGGMGVTYRARDSVLHRSVALKVIEVPPGAGHSEVARERFLREARAAAALRHPNVAAIYQFGTGPEPDRCYYAMELVEGETLEARVRREGPLKVAQVLEIGVQVTRALSAAANQGLIHRDLKPGNIMLTRSEDSSAGLEVKVIDFGLAKVTAESFGEMDLTHGGFVGTPNFASPEQFERGPVDVRSDIYSLGATLWFALTGKTLFAGRDIEEIRSAQKSNVVPVEQLTAARVPPSLRSLLKSMLAFEPGGRPGIQDLAAQLRRCSALADIEMAADGKKEIQLEIAHVLFIDIVGYSKLSINEEQAAVDELTQIVRSTEQFQKAEAAERLIKIPSGDGMALVFYTSPEAPVRCAMQISRALKEHPRLHIRMGIHSGPVSGVVDVTGRSNLAGAGVNLAQRVMKCGDAGHILISKRVAEDLSEFDEWRPLLHDLGRCEVKHGVQVAVVNLCSDDVGNRQLPQKFQTFRKQRTRVRWAEVAAALLLLAGIVAAFVLVSKKSARSTSIAPEKSIAVLPFENLSGNPENTYFTEGIQEEILTRLANIADLKVISRTSTQHFKSSPDNLRQIAQQLGVANVLEGSVQRTADRVHVNVQLIKAASDAHLWAEAYDRKLTDIFAVESEIAKTIAETLQAKLSGSEQHAIAAQPTENTEAHQLYLKGRYLWNRRTGENLKKALAYFEQAAEKDPHYALAYTGMADSCTLIPFYSAGTPQDYRPRARAAAQKAVELDDTLAEAHASLAFVFFVDFENAQSVKEFERAISLNPNYAMAHHWYGGFLLSALGRFNQAIAEEKRALELDPVVPIIGVGLGGTYTLARRYDEAIAQLHDTVEMHPEFYWAHRFLGMALELKGATGEAIAEYHKAFELYDDPVVLAQLAHAQVSIGKQNEARQILGELTEEANARYVPAYAFALIHLALGEKDQALDWLEKAVRDHDGFYSTFIKVDPYLDPLRGDPRFEALVQKVLAAKNTDAESAEQLPISSESLAKSIAVLPFENLSRDPDNAYFAQGIQEEILTRLTSIADLRVISRTSTQQYQSKPPNLAEIARQLGVGNIVEGSVQKAAGQVRVNVQLVNAQTDTHLWADTFDRKLTDIFGVESEIARRIAESLQAKLTGREEQALAVKPTNNPEAYDRYLLGRFELNKFTENGFTNSLAHFQQAIAFDPKFALAYAGLAEGYNMLGYWGYLPPKEAFPEAKRAVQKALALDPDSAEAHVALAYIEFEYEWKFSEAEAEFKEAIRLNPNSVSARLRFAEYLSDFQRAREAHEQLERARELDPLSIQISFLFAAESFFARDFDRALERIQKTISMDPNNALAYGLLGAILYEKRMPAEAFTAYEKANSLEGIFSNAEMAEMRKAYETAGLSACLRKENELRHKHLAEGKYQSPLNIALRYAIAGADSEALDWLERAVDERTPWLPELKTDPTWDAIRSQPRFVAVLKKIGLEK